MELQWQQFKKKIPTSTHSNNKNNITGKLGIPTELVLFAGVGGCSIGDKACGFDVKWLVENDAFAAASLCASQPDANIFQEDVGIFLDKCSDEMPGYPKQYQVDHLQSSPPCKEFSKANRGGGG